MRIKKIKLYKFDELSEKAKEKAREWYREGGEYAWSDEWRQSLEEFCRATGIQLKDWSIGPYSHSYIQWKYHPLQEIENQDLKGWRLRTWLINNWLPLFAKGKYYNTTGHYDENKKYHYKLRHSKIQMKYDNAPLTGYMGDQSLIDPVLDFINRAGKHFTLRFWEQTDLNDIVEECMNTFIRDWVADMEAQDSDEYIDETIIANEYEFTEDGEIA